MKQAIPALLFSFFILGLTCLSAQEKYKTAVYEHKAEGVKWVYGPDFGLFALANERDSLLTGFDFEQPAPFNEGAAVVKKGALYYFIDTRGKIISEGSPFLLPSIHNTYFNGNTVYARNGQILAYAYNERFLFSKQLLYTLIANNYTIYSTEENDSLFIFNSKDSKRGIIHQNGTVVLSPEYDYLEIGKSGHFRLFSRNMFGLTDHTGAILLPPVYDFIEHISSDEGRLSKTNISIRLDSLYGSYNLNMRKGVDCKYSSISNFVNGKAWASRNNMYYIVDSIGNEIVIAEKKACTILEDSLMVLDQNGIKTILNLENKTFAPEGASFLKKDGGILLFKKEDGTMLSLNIEGKPLLNKTYLETKSVGKNHFLVRDSTYCYGLIRSDGTVVQAPSFNHYLFSSSGYFYVALSQTDITSLANNPLPSGQDYLKQYDWTTRFYNENGDLFAETKSPFHRASRTINDLIHFQLDTGYVYYYKKQALIQYDGKSPFDHRIKRYKSGFFNHQGSIISDGFDAYYEVGSIEESRENPERREYITVHTNKMVGLLNKSGKTILSPIYQKIVYLGDSIFALIDKDKMGVADASGKIIYSPTLDTFIFLRHKIFLIKESGKWGALDRRGNYLADVIYENINMHEDGTILVKENGKYRYYCTMMWDNPVELEVVEPHKIVEDKVYETFEDFPPSKHGYRDRYSEGMAWVMLDRKYGFVNKEDSLVIPIIYNYAQAFQNGVAIVNKDGKQGIINKKGNSVVPLAYDLINQFQNGLAIVKKDNQFGIIDTNGIVVVPVAYDQVNPYKHKVALVKKGGKWGLLNKDFAIVQPCIYDEISIENYPTLGFDLVRNNGKFGLANNMGTILIPCEYDKIEVDQLLKNKLAYIHLDKRIGLIDRKGHIICTPKYDAFKGIGNRFMMVQKDKLWGAIDTFGKELISTSYQKCNFNDYRQCFMVKKNNLFGIIDTNFQMVVQPQFDTISNSLITSKKGQGMGLLDRHFQVHIPCKYQSITHLEQDKFLIGHRGLSGFVDISNAILILPTHFDEINRQADFETGYYFVKKGTKWGCVDKKGAIKVIPRFDAISCFKNGKAHVIIEPAQPIFLSFWGIKGETTYYPPSHAQPYPRDYLINTSGELLPIIVR